MNFIILMLSVLAVAMATPTSMRYKYNRLSHRYGQVKPWYTTHPGPITGYLWPPARQLHHPAPPPPPLLPPPPPPLLPPPPPPPSPPKPSVQAQIFRPSHAQPQVQPGPVRAQIQSGPSRTQFGPSHSQSSPAQLSLIQQPIVTAQTGPQGRNRQMAPHNLRLHQVPVVPQNARDMTITLIQQPIINYDDVTSQIKM